MQDTMTDTFSAVQDAMTDTFFSKAKRGGPYMTPFFLRFPNK